MAPAPRSCGQRSKRLLLPLLFGMAVIVPPQSYFEVVQQHGYAGSYLDFMRLYLSGYGGFCKAGSACLILPTWNHLWFVAYLFVYTAALWALLRVLATGAARPSPRRWRARCAAPPCCGCRSRCWRCCA